MIYFYVGLIKILLLLLSEFDALARLGIPDPSGYIKKRYKSNKLLFLRAACVGQGLVDQVEASVEEAVNSSTWTDLQVTIVVMELLSRSLISKFECFYCCYF